MKTRRIIASCFVLAVITAMIVTIKFFNSPDLPALSSYNVEGIVQINYKEIDYVCDNEELALESVRIFNDMQSNENILLSFVVDSSIEIEKKILGGYDHLVVVNPQWIERFGDLSKLKQVIFEDLTIGMRDFLVDQMPMWTKEGNVFPDGVNLYEYNSPLLAFPFMVGEAVDALVSEKSLLIMIENPVTIMNESSFLIPLSSSGNLIFTDQQELQENINNSAIKPYVSRISDIKTEVEKENDK